VSINGDVSRILDSGDLVGRFHHAQAREWQRCILRLAWHFLIWQGPQLARRWDLRFPIGGIEHPGNPGSRCGVGV
jgi:hypothetical protein